LIAFGEINNHILLNRLDMKMMVKNGQDLGAVIGGMIGKMKKDFPT
jgi:hypothetical protein